MRNFIIQARLSKIYLFLIFLKISNFPEEKQINIFVSKFMKLICMVDISKICTLTQSILAKQFLSKGKLSHCYIFAIIFVHSPTLKKTYIQLETSANLEINWFKTN